MKKTKWHFNVTIAPHVKKISKLIQYEYYDRQFRKPNTASN